MCMVSKINANGLDIENYYQKLSAPCSRNLCEGI
jgi:hypothetical protein